MYRQVLRPYKNIVNIPHYSNKKVMITGGGSGLGEQMALHYSKLGAKVTIIGRTEDKLKKAQRTIFNLTQHAVDYKKLDVSDYYGVTRYLEELERRNDIPDIVINNAAGNFISRTEDLSYNGWNKILDIVLKGTMNITLEFGKKMIEQSKHGIFVNISTTYAETGSGFVVPSSVAKAGCNNLTKSLAAEWGKYGLRFLSIAPGPIYTDGAFSRLDPSGNYADVAKEKLPLGRLGEKEELANLVTYLTSDYNKWMTGQVINLDGGEVVGNSGEFNILGALQKEDWIKMKEMILKKSKL